MTFDTAIQSQIDYGRSLLPKTVSDALPPTCNFPPLDRAVQQVGQLHDLLANLAGTCDPTGIGLPRALCQQLKTAFKQCFNAHRACLKERINVTIARCSFTKESLDQFLFAMAYKEEETILRLLELVNSFEIDNTKWMYACLDASRRTLGTYNFAKYMYDHGHRRRQHDRPSVQELVKVSSVVTAIVYFDENDVDTTAYRDMIKTITERALGDIEVFVESLIEEHTKQGSVLNCTTQTALERTIVVLGVYKDYLNAVRYYYSNLYGENNISTIC